MAWTVECGREIIAGKDHCFITHSAGWWYSIYGIGECNNVFLNGPHQPRDKDTDDSIFIKGFDEGKPLKGSVMLIRAMDATSRKCNNPCVKPNSVCTYVADLKRDQCICPLSMCGRDCNQICKDGRHCEYDATNDVNECKCHVGFDGPMCTAGGTTTSEPQSVIVILIGTTGTTGKTGTTDTAGTTDTTGTTGTSGPITPEPQSHNAVLKIILGMLILGMLVAVFAAQVVHYFTVLKRWGKDRAEAEEEGLSDW